MVKHALVHVMIHAQHAHQHVLVGAWIVAQEHARRIARVVVKTNAHLHVAQDVVIPVKMDA